MLQIVPVRPVPAQEFDIVLAQQACTITLYQKRGTIYMDLVAGGKPVIIGALCRDRSYIVRSEYLGFVGDMFFVDTQGEADPLYGGLGTRWILMYEGQQT